MAFYANGNSVTYFDSFGVEYIPKEIKRFIGSNSMITSIFRIQTYDLTMWGYFCNGFYVQWQDPGKFWEFIFTTQFLKEWWSDSSLLFEVEYKHDLTKRDFSSIR